MIAPQGEVTLCKVPWNPDYKHVDLRVMGHPGTIAATFGVSTTSNYTFIRQDSNIKVPYNADDIYGVNYVVYNNGGKAFCCFVTTVTYVSNNTTLLHLKEDVWQTWGGDIDWHPCFVAREHVNSDEIGEHLLPEPAMQFEQECVNTRTTAFTDSRYFVILTNAVPKLRNGTDDYFTEHNKEDFDGSKPVKGDVYNGVAHGAKAFAFDKNTEMSYASNFLNNLQLCGAGESICACFMIPSHSISVADHKVIHSSNCYSKNETYSFDHTCGNGYVPRNKKLLTYPYSYLNVTDHNGTSVDYQFEKFRVYGGGAFSNRSNLVFQFRWNLDPTASLVCLPNVSYEDSDTAVAATTPIAVQSSWSYGSYNNWVAQNAEKNQVKSNSTLITTIGGIGSAVIGAVLTGTGIGAELGIPLLASGAMMLSGLGVAAGGIMSQNAINAEIDAQSKVPDKSINGATNNTMYACNLNNFEFRNISVREDFASSLDDFFDQVGYEVDCIKTPNIYGRRSWNYVKTVGANVGGDIPADRLQVINQCLDAGITFWHTDDVGNYGLDNSIVS